MRLALSGMCLVFSSMALADSLADNFSSALASATIASEQGELCQSELRRTGSTQECKLFSKAYGAYREKLKSLKAALDQSPGGPEAGASTIPHEDWLELNQKGKKISFTIDYVDSFAELHK